MSEESPKPTDDNPFKPPETEIVRPKPIKEPPFLLKILLIIVLVPPLLVLAGFISLFIICQLSR